MLLETGEKHSSMEMIKRRQRKTIGRTIRHSDYEAAYYSLLNSKSLIYNGIESNMLGLLQLDSDGEYSKSNIFKVIKYYYSETSDDTIEKVNDVCYNETLKNTPPSEWGTNEYHYKIWKCLNTQFKEGLYTAEQVDDYAKLCNASEEESDVFKNYNVLSTESGKLDSDGKYTRYNISEMAKKFFPETALDTIEIVNDICYNENKTSFSFPHKS
ncbi:Pheromone/general odorant binding protein [Cinara cedri]|uniref:Pheromone/general odorant binding protein n=1 Tax=Cinara cedri TaxID=506608 RepID=A0A5E4M8F8_9HEMI|nr:Pheromone/general odorant binding protein [Cinara cedri]